ncbi:MAG: hypothetical protein R2695_01255 [Acidimicrobiales bacterium]
MAYLRLLDDGDERRIGRRHKHPGPRCGHATRLVTAVHSSGPWVLDAQAHLVVVPPVRVRGGRSRSSRTASPIDRCAGRRDRRDEGSGRRLLTSER